MGNILTAIRRNRKSRRESEIFDEEIANLNLEEKAGNKKKETVLTNQSRQTKLQFEQQQLKLNQNMKKICNGVRHPPRKPEVQVIWQSYPS